MDLFKKMGIKLQSLFQKYQLGRKDFTKLQVPDTIKDYDINEKPKRIRTSREK